MKWFSVKYKHKLVYFNNVTEARRFLLKHKSIDCVKRIWWNCKEKFVSVKSYNRHEFFNKRAQKLYL